MKLGRIKAAMSLVALLDDVVNTSAWIWRVQDCGLVGVRGGQPELGQNPGESINDLRARRPERVQQSMQSVRGLLGRQLSWV